MGGNLLFDLYERQTLAFKGKQTGSDMRVRWGIVMLPAVVVSVALLAGSQFVFLRMSFFRDRGFGLIDTQPTLGNYAAVATTCFASPVPTT
jgi:hypothetical protein